MNWRRLITTSVAGLCATWLAWAPTAGALESARDARDATGIRGGLVVHVGCGDGRLAAALSVDGKFLVCGLDADADSITKARARVRAAGGRGRATVERWTRDRLPFVDNLVNLVIGEDLGTVPMAEVMRVLAPGGVAYVKTRGRWRKTVKPRPTDIDEWTHFLHGPDGNAVAHDTVAGPPRHMQWTAAPTWTRNHHKLASISSVVTTRGRLFYILDEAPAASMKLPGKWSLVARDAFNGVLLWKRPMSSWAYHGHGFRAGPVQLPRTLVAGGERVYAPLGMSAPVSAVDAGSGEIVRTYESTGGAEEIILDNGVLLVVTGSPLAEQAGIDPALRGKTKFPNEKAIVAIRAGTGEELWRWKETGADKLMPLTLAADAGHVFFQVGKGVVCLDAASGKERWRTTSAAAAKAAEPAKDTKAGKAARKRKGKRKKSSGQRRVGWPHAALVVNSGVVLWSDAGRLRAFSADTGKALWDCPSRAGLCRSPADVLVVGGLVWLGPGFTEGRDLRTGEVTKRNAVYKELWSAGHHHRCYRNKATDRYIMSAYRGIEFLDLAGDDHSRNNWIRGTCQYGVMPANGLVYAPSHSCGCFMEAKLYGFWALAAARQAEPSRATEVRLEKGPAYGKVGDAAAAASGDNDWPTLRGNALRSGSTAMKLPAELGSTWQAEVGGRLSAPVAAGGIVIVSSIDAHRVVALDAANGKTRWEFTAGGRVDSPPTIHKGRALFGCADGWVYCLRASDGVLAWRFRAAPEPRRTVALDRVESVWPVHGSVLVDRGVAYAAAGRSSYLDGGIYLYGLDPATGNVASRGRVRTAHSKFGEGKDKSSAPRKGFVQNATDYKTFAQPDRSDAFSMGGTTTDVLVSDGSSIYMRQVRFAPDLARKDKMGRHLLSTSRLLDDAEVHRSHWVLGTGDFSRTPVAYSWIAWKPGGWGSRLAVPYGLMLAFDDRTVWGVKRTRGYGYKLFAGGNRPFSTDEPHVRDFRKASASKSAKLNWIVDIAMRPRACVRSGEALVLGGMPVGLDSKDPHAAYEGRKGGLVWVHSAADGKKLAEHELGSPPVWDGMALAGGRVYIATMGGRVVCLGGGR